MTVFNFVTCFHLYVPLLRADIKFFNGAKKNTSVILNNTKKGEKDGQTCMFIMIIYAWCAWSLLLQGDKSTISLTQVSGMNNLDVCMRLRCKAPLKELRPFLIGSFLDKKQVSLACEGAGPSSQFCRHSWQPLVRGGKRLNWFGLNMNGFKLGTWLHARLKRTGFHHQKKGRKKVVVAYSHSRHFCYFVQGS